MPSIEKRKGCHNSWRLTVEAGYKPDGGRNRERKTIVIDDQALLKLSENCAKYKDAPKKLKEYLDEEWYKFKMEVEAGEYVKPGRMTFQEFVETQWLKKYAEDGLSPTTLKYYKEHLNSRIFPVFGHKQIDQIKTLQVVTFLKDLQKPGARKDGRGEMLSIGTIQYVYRVLKNVFTQAEAWKVVSEKNNPMKGCAKPNLSKSARNEEALKKARESKLNPQYYDENEAQSVVDALYKESRKWRLLILGSMIGGFRRGELIGLEWPYVKFEEGALEIENNIPLTENGKPVEKGPKSQSSYRSVDMPDWYMAEMKTYYREWLKEKWELGEAQLWKGGERQFVFHNGTGTPYYYQHPQKWWKRFCKRHKLRYIKFHGLRHSSGTLLIEDEEGGNMDAILKALQERLGHSRLSTTTDIYVHVTKKVSKRTAGKYDKFAPKNRSIK